MHKFNDLSGQRFGRLLVVSGCEPNRHGQRRWLCKCDCGTETRPTTGALNSGTKSCGCARDQSWTGRRQSAQLAGRRFGYLTVMSEGPRDRFEHRQWVVRCECGIEVLTGTNSLLQGQRTSCGCRRGDSHRLDLAGQKFGRWTVIEMAPSVSSRTAWKCLCSCGKSGVVRTGVLRAGHSRSCGCLAAESRASATRTHGATRGSDARSAGYTSWSGMKNRCRNPNSTDYESYGGRGIRVCERWLHSFENFIADMGPRPSPRHSIDRVDVNGHYEPGNCRWADPKQQKNNQRLSDDRVRRVLDELSAASSDVDRPVIDRVRVALFGA